MQLYRGMDIGTAKLTMAQRQGVPHHLLDVWDVRYPANVAEYQAMARGTLAEVASPWPGAHPGRRLRAVPAGRPGRPELPRHRSRRPAAAGGRTRRAGPGRAARQAGAPDPGAAAGILPWNGRRIVRALEVIELSGKPFTATLPRYESLYPSVQIGLRRRRAELDRRIAERVWRMWRACRVDEVRGLEQAGLRDGKTASQALGYAQVLPSWPGSCPRTRPAGRPSRPPAGSPAARKPGSAAIPGWRGWTRPRARTCLPTALATIRDASRPGATHRAPVHRARI